MRLLQASDPIEGWRVNELELHSYTTANFVSIDVKRAWELPGALHDIKIPDLEYVLDEESWGGASPRKCAHLDPHWTLVLEADLDYPIIVTTTPNGEREVVDGRHRIVKAWLLGMESIRAKAIRYEDLLSVKISLPAFAWAW